MLLPSPRDAAIAALREAKLSSPVVNLDVYIEAAGEARARLKVVVRAVQRGAHTFVPGLVGPLGPWFDGFGAMFPGLSCTAVTFTFDKALSATDWLGTGAGDLTSAGQAYAAALLQAIDDFPAPPWNSTERLAAEVGVLFSGSGTVLPVDRPSWPPNGRAPRLDLRPQTKRFECAAGDIWVCDLKWLRAWFEVPPRTAHQRAETMRRRLGVEENV